MASEALARRAGERPSRPVVFVNAAAGGRGVTLAGRIEAALDRAAIDAAVQVVAPAEVGPAVRAACARGVDWVGVAGGDGSVSTAATELVGTGRIMAVFPAGTLNHFARRLELEDLDAACAAVRGGRTLRLPVGMVNGRVFINNASCGMYPHMVRHRERWRRWIGKWPAAAVSSIAVAGRLPMLDVRIDVPGARLRRRTPVLWVGIGRGSFQLPEPGRTAAGAEELEIVIAWAETKRALAGLAMRSLWRLVRRRLPTAEHDLETVYAGGFRLDSRRPVDIALDGEPDRMGEPLEFRLIPQALRVLVPRPRNAVSG